MPIRIQRSRKKGSQMPEGAIYVGRPTKFGNPYKVGDPDPMWVGGVLDAASAVRMYEWYLAANPHIIAAAIRDLAGHDLACFCKLDRPCHADILLKIANGGKL